MAKWNEFFFSETIWVGVRTPEKLERKPLIAWKSRNVKCEMWVVNGRSLGPRFDSCQSMGWEKRKNERRIIEGRSHLLSFYLPSFLSFSIFHSDKETMCDQWAWFLTGQFHVCFGGLWFLAFYCMTIS